MTSHAQRAIPSHAWRGRFFGGRPSRSRRRAVLVALVVAVGVAVALAFVVARRGHHTSASSAADAPADVPRREGDAIILTDAARERAGIETAPVARGALTPEIHVVGVIAFDPTRVAAVGTRAPGIVTKVLHVEGDHVAAGDLLAVSESPDVTKAQADLHVAAAKKKAALANELRERRLLARGLTTAREHEQALSVLEQQNALEEAARERVETLGAAARPGISELRAPVAGIVAERAIAPGQNVGPSLIAFRVGSLDRVWILLRLFERHVGLVREGDAVDVRLVADSRRTLTGTIAHVGSVLDPGTRTTDARVEVDNRDLALRPGEAVDATIHAGGSARVGTSVPETAITYVDGRPTVFVAQSPNRFVARTVELGLDGGDRVEIVQGVGEGEQVVVKSVLALKSELFR